MDKVFGFIQDNFILISAIGWWIDQGLKIIAPLTPTKLDDNLSDILGKLLARFLPKR